MDTVNFLSLPSMISELLHMNGGGLLAFIAKWFGRIIGPVAIIGGFLFVHGSFHSDSSDVLPVAEQEAEIQSGPDGTMFTNEGEQVYVTSEGEPMLCINSGGILLCR